MSEVLREVATWLWAALLVLAFAKFVEIGAAYVLGRLRLADWFGWVFIIAGLVTIPRLAWHVHPWLITALLGSAVAGVLLARGSIKRWRSEAAPAPVGYFLLGKPPQGVVNWVTR
ncbi:MAG: hypothetical protein Q4G67_06980 [Actinomycetia bacterium]|nr:hypothetical protein [Actinomycetes bacterium]